MAVGESERESMSERLGALSRRSEEPGGARPGDGDLGLPLVDFRLRGLLRHWLDLPADRGVPERRDFDPSRVGPALGYFWILRREPEQDRWSFALAGEDIILLTGRSLVGERVEDVFPEDAERFYAAIHTVVSTPAVLHTIGPMYRTDRATVVAERLALPMREGGVIDRIYGATVYHWPERMLENGARFLGATAPTLVPVSTIARTR